MIGFASLPRDILKPKLNQYILDKSDDENGYDYDDYFRRATIHCQLSLWASCRPGRNPNAGAYINISIISIVIIIIIVVIIIIIIIMRVMLKEAADRAVPLEKLSFCL